MKIDAIKAIVNNNMLNDSTKRAMVINIIAADEKAIHAIKLRIEDGASSINEANELRTKIQELEQQNRELRGILKSRYENTAPEYGRDPEIEKLLKQ